LRWYCLNMNDATEIRPRRSREQDGARIYIDCFCPEWDQQMALRPEEMRFDRRTFVVGGDNTEEALLEAINALTFFAKWTRKVRENPKKQLFVAPEESDSWPGSWLEFVGVTKAL
jgi:hypothetical protein